MQQNSRQQTALVGVSGILILGDGKTRSGLYLNNCLQHRITCKLCLLMYSIHTSQAPSCLADIVTQTASVALETRLWSSSSL